MGVDGCLIPLRQAGSFVELARAVTAIQAVAPTIGIVVEIWARNGPPVVSADDIAADLLPCGSRLRYLKSFYARDPLRAAMLAVHGPVGTEVTSAARFTELARALGWSGPLIHPLYLPLVDDSGVIGAIRVGLSTEPSRRLRTDLLRFAGHASIRLAKLGIGPAEEHAGMAALTRRQRQVGQLAIADHSNREIADALGLSIDTVKKHLKDTFARLQIASRRELRREFARVSPVTEIPGGVTARDGLMLARLDLHERTQ